MPPRRTRARQHQEQEQQVPSEPGEGPSPSPLLAWDDAAAAAAWVGPVLAFLPGGMPEAMGGLGAACRGARAAVVRALQRDVTLGQSPAHSPLPCSSPPTTDATAQQRVPPHPGPFLWTDALLVPPALRDRALVEEGCACTEEDGDGCCSPNAIAAAAASASSTSTSSCPCLARAVREAKAAAAAAAGGTTAGVGGRGDGDEVVWPFECVGPRCRCPAPRCRLRATQRRRQGPGAAAGGTEREGPPLPPPPPLELRFLGPEKGWGLFLRGTRPLAPGAFVAEYTGELLPSETARARLAAYDAQGLNYLLVVREESSALVLRSAVDATRVGGAGRFVNHSCEPNLELVMVRRGGLLPHLALASRRHIDPGEELTLDYGESSLPAAAAAAVGGSGGSVSQQQQGSGRRHPCLCGAATCRLWLPYFAGV